MTTREYTPQVSWWCIVVPAELVDPSVVLGRMADSQINMTPECLVYWRIFGEPGTVTEDRIPTTFYEMRYQAETGARCNLGVPGEVLLGYLAIALHVKASMRCSSAASTVHVSQAYSQSINQYSFNQSKKNYRFNASVTIRPIKHGKRQKCIYCIFACKNFMASLLCHHLLT